ncbi:MAG: transposase [Symploca sp. SIO2G7]|nr:transposase [Symploca sp. SIO2G7]
MSGPRLGRPPKNVSQSEKRQASEDERIRNRVEGKFGTSKRRYGLNRVMAKLPHTSETVIAITLVTSFNSFFPNIKNHCHLPYIPLATNGNT